jgi:hypothetical protein
MVRVVMIVEMAGCPAQHVRENLEKHVGVLKGAKDIEVDSIKVSEPKEMENNKGIFTCFSEVEFETLNFSRLSEVVFDFMPSSVEVIEPSNLNLNISEATSLLNNISGRFHRYDEIARMAKFRIDQLTTNLKQAQEELDKKEKKKSKKKVSKKKPSKKKKS